MTTYERAAFIPTYYGLKRKVVTTETYEKRNKTKVIFFIMKMMSLSLILSLSLFIAELDVEKNEC